MLRLAPTAVALAMVAGPAWSGSVVATHTIRAQTVLGPGDIALAGENFAGAIQSPDAAIGLEARVNLFAGRPIHPEDLGPPALLERNQLVVLIFAKGRLRLQTEGRALDRAGVGERVRVMNMDSRTVVYGTVTPAGAVEVGV